MEKAIMLHFVFGVLAVLGVSLVKAEDPYLYYTWTVTYGTRSNLGVPQRVILINNQFPGPELDVVTNNTIMVNVINKLDQPFSLTWNGIKQRKNYGVLRTNCPIPPDSNFTYKFQAKDQIGSYTYFPSSLMHRAARGFGALNTYRRSLIPTGPAAKAANDFILGMAREAGKEIFHKGLDILRGDPTNGQDQPPTIDGTQGETYVFTFSNVRLSTPLNFSIQDHTMKIVQGDFVNPNSLDFVSVPWGKNHLS